jgi:hypothetical protein
VPEPWPVLCITIIGIPFGVQSFKLCLRGPPADRALAVDLDQAVPASHRAPTRSDREPGSDEVLAVNVAYQRVRLEGVWVARTRAGVGVSGSPWWVT